MDRKLRTRLSLLLPQKQNEKSVDMKMKNQFDRKHGVKSKKFQAGDPVWIKKHSLNTWKWIPGRVKSRKGKVNYLVEISGQKVLHFHANQMRIRVDKPKSNTNRFLWTMFHTFDVGTNQEQVPAGIPPAPVRPDVRDAAPGEEQAQVPRLQPAPPSPPAVPPPDLRRSSRSRHPPKRLVY